MNTNKKRIAVWVLGAVLAGAGWSAERNPPDNPNDPCSPTHAGPPPFLPCEKAKPMPDRHMGTKPAHGKPAGQRLYPPPDGKGGPCTVPWTTGDKGQPYCRGEIIE